MTLLLNPAQNPIAVPNATSTSDGAMSAADKAKLDGILPGGANTLQQDYDVGTVAADQTLSISPAKGGPVLFKAAVATVGSLLRALTSVSAVVFDVVDAAIPKVRAAGAFIQNDPGFGSPVMGAEVADGPTALMGYTSNGNGPTLGGTGMTALQNPAAGDDGSQVVIHTDDLRRGAFVKRGFVPGDFDAYSFGVDGLGGLFPLAIICANQIYSSQTDPPIIGTVDANAGAGATASLTRASDSAMLLTLNTGVGAVAGRQLTIKPNVSFLNKPIVTLTPANSAASQSEIYVDEATISINTIPIWAPAPLGDSDTFKWYVTVIGK